MSENKIRFDAIVAFPFGTRTEYLSANWHIAMRATMLSVEYGLPLVAHVRVPVRMVVASLSPYGKISVTSLEVIDGNTVLDTANSFYSYAGWETWRNILVVAAPIIGERCIRDIDRVSGAGRFQLRLETALGELDELSWFGRDDKRFLVRHPVFCALWEVALCGVPWPVYRQFARKRK